jgi:hypothetical protein
MLSRRQRGTSVRFVFCQIFIPAFRIARPLEILATMEKTSIPDGPEIGSFLGNWLAGML